MEIIQCLLEIDLSCACTLISASFPLPITIELFIKLEVGIVLEPDFSAPHGSGRMNAEEVYMTGPEEDKEVFGVASCGDATTGDEDDKGVDDRGLMRENRAGE
jgi:hypothetical protein